MTPDPARDQGGLEMPGAGAFWQALDLSWILLPAFGRGTQRLKSL